MEQLLLFDRVEEPEDMRHVRRMLEDTEAGVAQGRYRSQRAVKLAGIKIRFLTYVYNNMVDERLRKSVVGR